MPAGLKGEIVASLVVQEASASLTLFDDAGQALGTAPTFEQISVRTTFVERRIDGPRYYVLVTATSAADAAYQLTIAARAGRWRIALIPGRRSRSIPKACPLAAFAGH